MNELPLSGGSAETRSLRAVKAIADAIQERGRKASSGEPLFFDRFNLERVIEAALRASAETICSCGTTMVCPDIGCDKNKLDASAPALQETPRDSVKRCEFCGEPEHITNDCHISYTAAPSSPETT